MTPAQLASRIESARSQGLDRTAFTPSEYRAAFGHLPATPPWVEENGYRVVRLADVKAALSGAWRKGAA